MPARPAEQTAFLRVRWRIYLQQAFADERLSRAKVAESLELPTSRVSQWLAGERGVEASTAFEVGELLRERFGLATSGPDALFAAGHFADLLRLLRAYSVADEDASRRHAVALFTRLPGRFLREEIAALDSYPATIPGYRIDENSFDGYEESRLRLDAAGSYWKGVSHTLAGQVSALLDNDSTSASIRSAWQRAQLPIDNLPEVNPPIGLFLRSAPLGSSAVGALLSSHLAAPDLAVAATIEVVIALALALERRNPSTSAPRLWRMLAEWAHALDREAFARFSPLLPPAYSHFSSTATQSP